MPATNYTPIQFYRSTTSGAQPSNANLSPGELALNIADNDMTMYFENASGTVKRFFNNPAALKYPTADGTSGQIISTNASGVLSFADAGSSAITDNTRQAVTSSATTTIDLASGQVIDLTMAASITSLSFTNVPASGTPILVQIVVKNASDGTAYTIAWPSSVYWSGQYTGTTITNVQTAPTLATGANGVTTIALLTTDGGTKWRGWVEGTIPGGSQLGLYSWGLGSQGRLGQNSTTTLSSPVQVGSLTNWMTVSSGKNGCVAVKTDGTLWSWGYNNVGQLGLNDRVDKSSPVQIGSLTTWLQASAGYSLCAAVKTDGTLWAWGSNDFGQLGQNHTDPRSSPVQVGALTNWSSVKTGGYFCAAIKTNGTLWSWGRAVRGRLGLGNETYISSPVQVGALTNWALVSTGYDFCGAVKTDGTLWTWGSGNFGKLGQNNTNYRSSPVQVGALTNWSSVSTGGAFCVAVKTNNTLWSWGAGFNGRLGQNSTTTLSSPVQIGALTDWASASAQFTSFCAAIKTNGTLWSWGENSSGQLGQNNITEQSSPVQVGALTSWSSASAGNNFCAAFVATTVNPG
jgi:alpha-tubulin suppressor-like RCC1 family protein